jgi:hypothetical protein
MRIDRTAIRTSLSEQGSSTIETELVGSRVSGPALVTENEIWLFRGSFHPPPLLKRD